MDVRMELDLIRINASVERLSDMTPAQKARAAFPKNEDEALRARYEKTLAFKARG